MRINNKGFTLVELLVAISILAILTILAIPTLRSFQANNSDAKFENYKKSLQTSGKLYNDSYSDDIFGEAPYGCELVPLSELMNKKVAKDISLKDVSCNISYNNSFVVLRKFNKEYRYESYLHCEDSKKTTMYDNMKDEFGLCANANKPPRVDVTYKDATGRDTKDKTVTVTLIDEYGFTANQSFEYAWVKESQLSNLNAITYTDTYNYNNEVKKSTGKEVTLKSKSILPKTGLTGRYFLVIKPKKIQNIVGLTNTEIKTAGPFEYDHTAPGCPEITVTDQNGKAVAAGKSAKTIIFHINFKNKESDFKSYDAEISVNDGDFKKIGSNEITEVYKPSADGKYVLKIKPRDYAGNVNNKCVSAVYSKDNIPPSCPTVTAKVNNKAFGINKWTDASKVNFTFKFSNDTVKWDWYTDSSTNDLTVNKIHFKRWGTDLLTKDNTKSIEGEGKRSVLAAVYDYAGNRNTDCVSTFWGIDRCGHTKEVGGTWSKWGNCQGKCGTGKQTRTKKVTLQSTLNTSKTCGTKNVSDERSCSTGVDCCSSVTYKNGTTCSAACGNGTYNQLAYSKYTNERCPKNDKASGGSTCKIKDCPKPITLDKPTITNKHNNKWTNSKYTFTMKTKSKAANVGSWWWKWKGGSWTQYSNSAGKNSLTSQKMDKEHDGAKLYVRVCSINASGVGDDANCATSDATTIKTDFTAPSKVDKGKKTKGDWYYWWFRYKDELSGLTAVNKSSGSNLYYCYNACSRDCKKKKHYENTWKGPDNIWYRQAEIQNNLERGNDKIDKLTMRTSKGCGKYKVHVYLKACDVAGNCTGLHKYTFDFT